MSKNLTFLKLIIYNDYKMFNVVCSFCEKLKKIDEWTKCFVCREIQLVKKRKANIIEEKKIDIEILEKIKILSPQIEIGSFPRYSKIDDIVLIGEISNSQIRYLRYLHKRRYGYYDDEDFIYLTKKEASEEINELQTHKMKKELLAMKGTRIIGGVMKNILSNLKKEGSILKKYSSNKKALPEQKVLLWFWGRENDIKASSSFIDSLTKREASSLIDYIAKKR